MDSSITRALKTLTYGLYIVTVSVGGVKKRHARLVGVPGILRSSPDYGSG